MSKVSPCSVLGDATRPSEHLSCGCPSGIRLRSTYLPQRHETRQQALYQHLLSSFHPSGVAARTEYNH